MLFKNYKAIFGIRNHSKDHGCPIKPKKIKGNLNSFVCKLSQVNISIEEFALGIKNFDLKALDLVALIEFDFLKIYDLSYSIDAISSKK
jgi:hypothetical protein